MNVGVVILHCIEGLEEKFKASSEQGFKHCQLISWMPTAWTDEEAEKVSSYSKKYGIEITAFWCGWEGPNTWNFYEGQATLGIVPETYRHARIKNLVSGCDFAKKLGVTDVVTHMGFLPENPNEKLYTDVVYAIRCIARHAAQNGQRILFETGQETPVTLLRTIEDVGTGNLGINLDPANLILYGKANPVDALDVFGQYVCGFHAKDGFYPTNGRELGREVAVGEGKANYPALIKRLHECGYDGSLTIEREISGEQQTKDIINTKLYLERLLSEIET